MSRNRRDDRHRMIGALVQCQERWRRRWGESDRDYIIRLAINMAEAGYYLDFEAIEPLTLAKLFDPQPSGAAR